MARVAQAPMAMYAIILHQWLARGYLDERSRSPRQWLRCADPMVVSTKDKTDRWHIVVSVKSGDGASLAAPLFQRFPTLQHSQKLIFNRLRTLLIDPQLARVAFEVLGTFHCSGKCSLLDLKRINSIR